MTTTDQQPEHTDQQGYTTSETLAFVGCRYRWLDYALRCGYLTTETDSSPGSGRLRVFTSEEIDVLHAAHHLSVAGLRTDVAFRIAHEIADSGQYARVVGGIYQLVISVQAPTEQEPQP